MLIDMKVVIVVYYDAMFLFLILKNRIFIKTYNDMTQKTFNVVFSACVGITISVLSNFSRIPSSGDIEKVQWVVDHFYPFVFWSCLCFGIIYVIQKLGFSTKSLKDGISRYFKKFCNHMNEED